MKGRAALVLAVLVSCSDAMRTDPGKPPDADHASAIRTRLDEVLARKHDLAGPSAYRFATPVPDRVATWHWEPQEDGRPHALGYRHGWRVDFWITPRYVGYPEQPESVRMAFFGDGQLRGIFVEGGGNAPLELDKWSPVWVDPDWRVAVARGDARR